MATRVQPAMPADSGETLTERAVAILRRDIVSGALAPAERLGVRDLVARLGIGATPIREALSRLAAQDLVEAIGRRGFRVAAIGRSDLEDLTRLRTLVEVAALQQAMARGDDAWEAGIVASLHRLQQAGGRGSRRARDDAAERDALHKEFHDALIAACGSRRLLALHDALYDQTRRYRRLRPAAAAQAAAGIEEHRALAEAVLARDVEAAATRLARHLAATLLAIYPAAAPDAAPRKPARRRAPARRRGKR